MELQFSLTFLVFIGSPRLKFQFSTAGLQKLSRPQGVYARHRRHTRPVLATNNPAATDILDGGFPAGSPVK